jgi:hypothetical protein
MARVLNYWKEIADYLGKSVRTVQRWERELGLPVRRPHGDSSKSAVLAIPEEIDAWVHLRHLRSSNPEFSESESTKLLALVTALQSENAALRRQLEAGQIKVAPDQRPDKPDVSWPVES